jgi:Tol biopolymer transport system component
MFSLVFATTIALAAPPPQPADKTGRITLWIRDKVESFLPDGTGLKSAPAPDVKESIGVVFCFTPGRKLAAYLSVNEEPGDARLIVNPLEEGGKRYTVNGYDVASYVPSADGSRIYFNAREGKVDKTKPWWKGFVLDLETRKVEPLPLPENNLIKAVSPDGKTIVTHQYVAFGKSTQKIKACLISNGGKPVEILKENTPKNEPVFSPDGKKVLFRLAEMEIGLLRPEDPREIIVLDIVSRTTQTIRIHSNKGILRGCTWSPDSDRIAYLWHGQKGAAVPDVKGEGERENEYKVFVADPKDGKPKEIYKVTDPDPDGEFSARLMPSPLFMWK